MIFVGAKTIVTPAARDAAKEYNIKLIVNEEPEQIEENNKVSKKQIGSIVKNIDLTQLSSNIHPDLIEKIVVEVISNLKKTKKLPELVKDVDPCGLRLIRGDSVYLENFNTGNSQDNIKLKELFDLKESPYLSSGFIEIENTVYDFEFKRDEICYVLEGNFRCIVNGNKYSVKAGDVLYIPANSKITFSVEDKVKYFFVNSLQSF